MTIAFPIEKQPLLQLDEVVSVKNQRKPKHPHGWSRDLEMLHEPGALVSNEVLNTSPLYLEIGCGHGDFLVHKASAEPNRYFIGIENVSFFAIDAAEKIEENGLTNVLIVNQNANRLIEETIPDQTLDGIYILYPDPWPKRRHRKRRLIREKTYEIYHDVLKPGGSIDIWTDTEQWKELSLPYLEKLPGSLVEEEVSEEIGPPRTYFEHKAKSKQHPIYHIRYERPGRDEHDDYS